MLFRSERKKGEALLFVSCVLEGFFPVIAHYGSGVMPPLFFLALSTLTSSILFALYLLKTKQFSFHLSRKEKRYIAGLVVFVMLPYQLIFIGTTMTTGINTALFLQAEILFAFLWSILFFNERPRLQKLAGAGAISLGMMLILFDGNVTISTGGLLILAATALFPVGNTFAKRALQTLPASKVLFLRSSIGGTIILCVSLIVEKPLGEISSFAQHLWLVPTYAIMILFISKMSWYTGLRTISLSTATSILTLAPAFGMVFAFVFLHETPSGSQIAGFLSALAGVTIVLRSHVPPAMAQSLV